MCVCGASMEVALKQPGIHSNSCETTLMTMAKISGGNGKSQF